jgi:hypothetical protein
MRKEVIVAEFRVLQLHRFPSPGRDMNPGFYRSRMRHRSATTFNAVHEHQIWQLNNGLKNIWKEAVVAYSKYYDSYLSGVKGN